jgi:hypothetical protein
MITAASVGRFCDVVGNHGEKFKASRNPDLEAPMDYAIVNGWQVRSEFLLSVAYLGTDGGAMPIVDHAGYLSRYRRW